MGSKVERRRAARAAAELSPAPHGLRAPLLLSVTLLVGSAVLLVNTPVTAEQRSHGGTVTSPPHADLGSLQGSTSDAEGAPQEIDPYLEARVREAFRQRLLEIEPVEGGRWRAWNKVQAHFDAEGLEVAPASDLDARVRFQTTHVNGRPVGAETPLVDGTRLTYARGPGLREVWIHRDVGLEQTLEVDEPCPEIVLEGRFDTDLQFEQVPGRGVVFRRDGEERLGWGEAVAIDANGVRGRVETEVASDGVVRWSVAPTFLASAAFPVRLDPIIADLSVDSNLGSNPSNFAEAPSLGLVFFQAMTPSSGAELWATNGTGAGTRLVKDIKPGVASSSPSSFVEVNGGPLGRYVLFAADDGVNGTELWRSDGTDAGTYLVHDIFSGVSHSLPSNLTLVPGSTVVVFSALSGTGFEPWTTDGTSGGTAMLADLNPGAGSSSPQDFTQSTPSGSVFFVARGSDTSLVPAVWETTGSGSPNLWSGGHSGYESGSLTISRHPAAPGGAYWYLLDTQLGTSVDLYQGDVRTAGEANVGSMLDDGLFTHEPTDLGGVLYLAGQESAAAGTELMAYDPLSGLSVVADIEPTLNFSSSPQSLVVANGALFFSALTIAEGRELWRSTGSLGSTDLIKDIAPGTLDSDPTELVEFAGRVFFTANDGGTGVELWRSDGSPDALGGNTSLIADIEPGPSGSSPGSLTVAPSLGWLFLTGSNSTFGQEPWISDSAGTASLLIDINKRTVGSSPNGFIRLGNVALFVANTQTHGSELWRSDGTPLGTTLVKDIFPGLESSGVSVTDMAVLGDHLYFGATDGVSGFELWRSDGTPGRTELVKDINPGTAASIVHDLTVLGGSLYFTALDSQGFELWVSDGTNAGTSLAVDLTPGPAGSNPTSITPMGGRLYFSANDGLSGFELWRSDGTASGTALVKDVRTGSLGSAPQSIIAAGNRLFFDANDGVNGRELWVSDGISTTTMVMDIRSGAASGVMALEGVTVRDIVIFVADDGTTGLEPWRSDGTAAGTFRLSDIWVGISGSSPASFVTLGSLALFAAKRTATDRELYRTDGTVSGTSRVRDLSPGILGSGPDDLTVSQGRVYFAATTPNVGRELWASDGTSTGTVQVDALSDGGNPSALAPTNLSSSLGTLVCAADTFTSVSEPFLHDPPGPLEPAPRAVFQEPRPTLSWRAGVDPEGDKVDYHVQWATDRSFSSGLGQAQTDQDPPGFSPDATLSPYVSADVVRYTMQTPLSGTYWWRVRQKDPLGSNAWGPWSWPQSFTVDASLGASPDGRWRLTSFDDFDVTDRVNAAASGGGLIINDQTANGGVGRLRTPVVSLAQLDSGGDLYTYPRWKTVRANISHPDAITRVRVRVYDGQTNALLLGPVESRGTGPVFPETSDLVLSLSALNPVPASIFVEIELVAGSTPTVNELEIEGDSQTTAVTLTELRARGYAGEVQLEWRTGVELQNLGFHVYRSELPDRDFVRITPALLLGMGDALTGGSYYLRDQTVEDGKTYYYLLEDLELSGLATLHGPVSATPETATGAAPTPDEALYENSATVTPDTWAGGAPPATTLPDGSAGPALLEVAPGVRVLANEISGFDLEIVVPRFTRGTVEAGGETYDLVEIPGYASAPELSRPVVPARSLLVEVPPVASASLSDVRLETEVSSGYWLPANLPVDEPPPLTEVGPIPATHAGDVAWPEQPLVFEGVRQVGDRTFLAFRVNPVQYTASTEELAFHRRILARITLGPAVASTAPTPAEEEVQRQLATSPGVVTFTVEEDGVYRLSGADLAAAGFDLSGDPTRLTVYARGRQVPIRVVGGEDGAFDPQDAVEFYAQRNQTRFLDSPHARHSAGATYYLAWGGVAGERVASLASAPVSGVAPQPRYAARYRVEAQRAVYSLPLQPAGRDHWFHAFLAGGTYLAERTETIALDQLAPPLTESVLRYRLQGASAHTGAPDHAVELWLNGTLLGTVTLDGLEGVSGELPAPNVQNGANTLRVKVASKTRVYLDHLELEVPRRFVSGDRASLRCQPAQSGAVRLENFATSDVEVWAVTEGGTCLLSGGAVEDAGVVRHADGSLSAGPSYQVELDPSAHAALGGAELLGVTSAAKRTPARLSLHAPQRDLRAGANGADWIAITSSALKPAAERLAAYRQGQGLRSVVVTTDEVMDQFAWGERDPEGIRRFLAHAWERWSLPRPKYVVLVGDGHFDEQDWTGLGAPSHVPAYMIESEFNWTASDTRYGCVAGNDGLPELLVGRLPVTTLAAAERFVDKLLAYEAAPWAAAGDRAVLLADDTDIYDFAATCRELAGRLPEGFAAVEAFHVKGGDASALRSALLGALNGDGALLTVYAGHGNTVQWGNEGFLRTAPVDDLLGLTNTGRPTVGIVLNCYSGAFMHPASVLPIMGEQWLAHEGGAVAFWASTGSTRPAPQDLLGRYLFDVVFGEGVGVLGDAIQVASLRLVAREVGAQDVIDTWVLLGDPAMSLLAETRARAQPNSFPPPPPSAPVVFDPVAEEEDPITVSAPAPEAPVASAPAASGSSGGCGLTRVGSPGSAFVPLLAFLAFCCAARRRGARGG
jgi:ELWxxDGT repeat protein